MACLAASPAPYGAPHHGATTEPRTSPLHILEDSDYRVSLGGYVEPGESVEVATQREVREETGYEIEVGRLVGVYSDPGSQVIEYEGGRRVQAVNLCFEAVVHSHGELITPEETLEVGFFDTRDLPEPFVPIHQLRVEDALESRDMARVR